MSNENQNQSAPLAEIMDVLLPCPFCGGAADIREIETAPPKWIVRCDSLTCLVNPVAHGVGKSMALARWNYRSQAKQNCETNVPLLWDAVAPTSLIAAVIFIPFVPGFAGLLMGVLKIGMLFCAVTGIIFSGQKHKSGKRGANH